MLVVQGYVLGDVALGEKRRTRVRPVSKIWRPTGILSTSACSNKGLVNKSFPRAGVLAYPQPACFDDLLSDLKLLREQSQLGIIS